MQYIAVNVGWGGSPVMNLTKNGQFRFATAKLLVFKLGAKGVTLPPMPPADDEPVQPNDRVAPEVAARGAALYGENCSNAMATARSAGSRTCAR